MRARRALILFKDVPLRTKRALLLYKVNGNSAVLVLNRISLNSIKYFLCPCQFVCLFVYYSVMYVLLYNMIMPLMVIFSRFFLLEYITWIHLYVITFYSSLWLTLWTLCHILMYIHVRVLFYEINKSSFNWIHVERWNFNSFQIWGYKLALLPIWSSHS